jgi:uracil-DNA glycosylase
MPDIRQLLRDSYSCSRCPEMFGFSTSPNGSYFKFPPIIGATGKADILFVGINPRRSDTNLHLHQSLMTSKRAFKDLSANRINGAAYIDPSSGEPHYHHHLEIIRKVYGKPRTFESCAAVTELFLCASENSTNLPNPESPCAAHFLPQVLNLIQPQVIVAVGSRVFDYFKTKVGTRIAPDEIIISWLGRNFPVVRMPHPGNKHSDEQRRSEINTCIRKIRKHLGKS